jgi:hypothetical protein
VHTNPAALLCHRTFDEGVYPKRPGNLWHRELRTLEAHNRDTGNDAQIMDSGQASAQLFGHSSARYSCVESPDRLLKGRTGSDLICGCFACPPDIAIRCVTTTPETHKIAAEKPAYAG